MLNVWMTYGNIDFDRIINQMADRVALAVGIPASFLKHQAPVKRWKGNAEEVEFTEEKSNLLSKENHNG
jgi:hypothetical protein